MNESLFIDRILSLLQAVPREPGSSLPCGAIDKDIIKFETTTGLTLPIEFIKWLKISNGPCIGPGGLYGIEPAIDFLRIETRLNDCPDWKIYNWFPIAGDGTGNYYLLDGNLEYNGYHPIYFVDHEVDLSTPAYVVASNIWTFLFFILQNEIDWQEQRKTYWPHDKNYVLSIDPSLECLDRSTPLPWQ